MDKKMIGFVLLWLLIACTAKDRNNSESNNVSSDSFFQNDPGKSIPKLESKTKLEGSQFTDERDGLVYKVFKCEGLIWMAENLKHNSEGTFCYNEDDTNCQKHGRLYTWATAQKACPKGWHLPSKAEWLQLAEWGGGYYSEEKQQEQGDASAAYARLMDQQFIGFAGQLGGRKKDVFRDMDQFGFYWSSSGLENGEIWNFQFDYQQGRIGAHRLGAGEACSCRCVLD